MELMDGKRILTIVNSLLSPLQDVKPGLVGLIVVCGTILTALKSILDFVSIDGVLRGFGGIETLGMLVLLSLVLTGLLFLLLRSIRWNLVSWGIRMDLDWFVKENPSLIVGIGPGGAIIAGIIAKHLAERLQKEPLVFVFDRVFEKKGPSLGVQLGNAGSINVELCGQLGKVLLVTSEVHSGNTMKLVHTELLQARVSEIRTFSFLVSTDRNVTFRVDRHIIKSDSRAILPWCDSPDRETDENVS